jgi:hypothetical protein
MAGWELSACLRERWLAGWLAAWSGCVPPDCLPACLPVELGCGRWAGKGLWIRAAVAHVLPVP